MTITTVVFDARDILNCHAIDHQSNRRCYTISTTRGSEGHELTTARRGDNHPAASINWKERLFEVNGTIIPIDSLYWLLQDVRYLSQWRWQDRTYLLKRHSRHRQLIIEDRHLKATFDWPRSGILGRLFPSKAVFSTSGKLYSDSTLFALLVFLFWERTHPGSLRRTKSESDLRGFVEMKHGKNNQDTATRAWYNPLGSVYGSPLDHGFHHHHYSHHNAGGFHHHNDGGHHGGGGLGDNGGGGGGDNGGGGGGDSGGGGGGS